MKKNILFFSAIASLIFIFSACKNDFNIAADWKEIPVVYGLLDADSSVQYIKVEKAFLDQHLAALQMAANPDSMYYHDALKITIDGFDTYGNLKDPNKKFTLVDGDTIGLPRQSGIFAKSPNLFFRLKSKLNENYSYNLTIKKSNGAILTTSTTSLVGRATNFNSAALSLITNKNYNSKVSVSFKGGVNSVFCDVTLRFKYMDDTLKNSMHYTGHHFLDMPLFSNLAVNNLTQAIESKPYFDARSLYEYVADELTPNSSILRTFEGIDFLVFGVNQNLVDYVAVQNAQAGITSGTAQLQYSNIANGLGIFASRSTTLFSGINISPTSLDSLKKGRYTYNLGFYN